MRHDRNVLGRNTVRLRWLLIVCWVMLATPAHAQVNFEEATPVRFGEAVQGRLDTNTPRTVYSFEGRRGEFLSVRLEVEDGNLDPVMVVLDDTGTVLASLDDGLERGALLDTLRIPRNGVYYVILTRFGDPFSITQGGYDLLIERVGVSSQSGTSLRYRDTIINTITDTNPQLYYSFQANQGDILNIRMQRISGDLDPLLQIVNSESIVIAASDDIPGSSTLDAAVDGLVIEADGTYVIVATRYGEGAGTSNGSFVLSLEETDDSGLGNTLLTAAPLPEDGLVEGEIAGNRFEQYFTFFGNENEVVTISMDRISGSLDAYLILLDEDLREVAVDDDSGGGQNAQLRNFRLPETGLYYVQATRFDGPEGESVGRFRVALERLGGAFDQVQETAQPILYGSTVPGVIDTDNPDILYAFYGQQGDIITVSMNRSDGNLDPVVAILGENLNPLISDDDSGGGQNARIERFVLGRTGVYYIRAARYRGPEGDSNTRGGYVLVLAEIGD